MTRISAVGMIDKIRRKRSAKATRHRPADEEPS